MNTVDSEGLPYTSSKLWPISWNKVVHCPLLFRQSLSRFIKIPCFTEYLEFPFAFVFANTILSRLLKITWSNNIGALLIVSEMEVPYIVVKSCKEIGGLFRVQTSMTLFIFEIICFLLISSPIKLSFHSL